LDGIGDEYKSNNTKARRRLSRLGRAFWGLVESQHRKPYASSAERNPRHLPSRGVHHPGRLGAGSFDATSWAGSCCAHGRAQLRGVGHPRLVYWQVTAVVTMKILARLVVVGLALFGAYRVAADYPRCGISVQHSGPRCR
jgi:hypothetical protein